jgi:hypothetical protein
MRNTLLPPPFGCRDVGNEPKAAGNRSRDLGNGARAVQHGHRSIRNVPNQEWAQGARNGLGTPGFTGRHKESARMGPGLPEAVPRQLEWIRGCPAAVGNGPQRPGIGPRNQKSNQGCRKFAHGCRNGPKATGPGPGLPGMSAHGCRECARGCQNGPKAIGLSAGLSGISPAGTGIDPRQEKKVPRAPRN